MLYQKSLSHFTTALIDALYEILNREDLNWCKLNLDVAIKVIKEMPPSKTPKAFVLDGSVRVRFGKKCQVYQVILN